MDLKVFGSKASLQNCFPETPRSGYKTCSKQYNKKPRCYSARQNYTEENCRPECVPTLDLRYLQEPETKSKVSIDCYDLTSGNPSALSSHRSFDSFTVRVNPHKHHFNVSSSHADVPTLDIQDSSREPNKKNEKTSVWDNAVLPEDLPKPSEKYKNLYNEYKEEMKSSYSQHKALSPVDNHSPSNKKTTGEKQCFENEIEDTLLEQCLCQLKFQSQVNSSRQSNMEELEELKKKEKLIETVMVDQLSRSVICDPEQDQHLSEPHSYVSHKPRGVNRFLHETSIKTRSTSTENLLSKKVRFGVRLLTQNDHDALRELMGFFFYVDNSLTIYEFRQFGKSAKALPFILRDVYQCPSGLGPHASTKCYTLSNIFPGADLEISCHSQPCLPETLKKQPTVVFRVTDVDEEEKSKILLANVLPSDQKDVYTKMHVPKEKGEREQSLLFAEVQQIVCNKLKKRGVRTVTGLSQHYKKLCQKSSAQYHLVKSDLEEGLKVFHIELPQTMLDQLFSYLDTKGSGFVDYTVYMRAVIGEMNEYRKSFVRKAYRKMRGANKDHINVGELKKFYRAGNQNNVFSGGELYDALQLMLGVLNKSSKETEVIRYIEWEAYYEGLSIGIESDVDFLRILKNLWSI